MKQPTTDPQCDARPIAVVYAPVENLELFDQVGFYRQDIEALRDLGFKVVATNSLRTLLTTKFDLLWIWWWTHGALPALIARVIRRRPAVITGVFNFEAASGRGYRSRPLWQRLPIAAAVRFATLNVFLTDYESTLVQRELDVDPSRVATAPLEISIDSLDSPVAERDDFFLQIAWSGRENLKRKCVFETIEAMEAYADAHGGARLLIAGNIGDASAELETPCRTAGHGLQAEYLGRISEEEKWRLLRTCRAYVSPSRFEGFGLAIAEAMAAGAPTVTSPVGSIPEVAGDEAFMCDGSDPASILTSIEQAADVAHADDRPQRGRDRILELFGPGTRRAEIASILDRLGVPHPS